MKIPQWINKRLLFALILILGFAVLLTTHNSVSFAATPSLVNYQGILTNNSGTPQVGTFSVTFKIYDVPAGGVALWSETQNSVTTNSHGLFNVLLGSSTPLTDGVFSGADRYLGTNVSPDAEMSPRTRIATVAYAFRPATVDGASGGTITSKVSIGPGHTNSGAQAFIAGANNMASGDSSTIAGGTENVAGGRSSVIGGGLDGHGKHYKRHHKPIYKPRGHREDFLDHQWAYGPASHHR